MSDSSQVQIAYRKETTWNEVPSTSNQLTNLNVLGDGLDGQVGTKKSGILRSDGNIKSIQRVGASAGGPLQAEFSYGEYDSLLEGLLRNTFSTAVSIAASTTIAFAAANHLTDSANQFTNVQVGQWLRIGITGGTVPQNAGFVKVTAKASAGDITVAGLTLATAAAGAGAAGTITIKGALLKNGLTDSSFLIEKKLATGVFDYYRGMEVAAANLEFPLEELVTGSFDFLGARKYTASSTQGTGTNVAAGTKDSFNTVDYLSVYIDGVLTTLLPTKVSLSITPNLRAKKALGNFGAVGIGAGTFNITGQLDFHNESNALLTDFDNFTTKSLAIKMGDGLNNHYVFDIPSVKLTSASRTVGGQDQDVVASCKFEAFIDPTLVAMIGVTRIPT